MNYLQRTKWLWSKNKMVINNLINMRLWIQNFKEYTYIKLWTKSRCKHNLNINKKIIKTLHKIYIIHYEREKFPVYIVPWTQLLKFYKERIIGDISYNMKINKRDVLVKMMFVKNLCFTCYTSIFKRNLIFMRRIMLCIRLKSWYNYLS